MFCSHAKSATMKSVLALVLTLPLLQSSFAGVPTSRASTSLQWIRAGQDIRADIFNLGLEPAGIEGTSYLYVCRVQPDPGSPRRVPGKLKVDYRHIAYITDELRTDYNQFEVLLAPPGTTSWVPSSHSSLPSNAVVGGELPDGSPAYICRAIHGNASTLVVGKYFKEEGQCKISYEGSEYTATESFDVLVVNMYGLKIGVSPDPN